MARFRLAAFRADVTPPLGSPLCGGRVEPVREIVDPLWALGVVLLSDEAPIVLCAVDWCLIRNRDHELWRERLADAAATTPDRVAVHTVHQHDAPQADREGELLLAQHPELPPHMDLEFTDLAMERTVDALGLALPYAQEVTSVRAGSAPVHQVGATRRPLGPDGKVVGVRYSACRDPLLRAEPEGEIDPLLRTVSFWHESAKLAALHWYAVHPMSHYGEGGVSGDFCGLARERRTAEEGVPHLYFTGCAGDVTAGKYNDGSPDNRPVLVERVHEAMVRSESAAAEVAVERLDWRSRTLLLPRRAELRLDDALATVADVDAPERQRLLAANRASILARLDAGRGTLCSSLHLGDQVVLLHLPGEMLIAYQLYAQSLRPDAMVAVAAYGDGGLTYVPPADAYGRGGYEVGVAVASPAAEPVVKGVIEELVQG